MADLVVKVRDVANQMDMMSDDITVYMHKRTGEFVAVSDEEQRIVEHGVLDDELPNWRADVLPKVKEVLGTNDFLPLPDRFEIHEWELMRRFCGTVEDADDRDALSTALHGTGAFRYFRDSIRRLGLEEAWYRYRDETLDDIARCWLEEHGIRHDREQSGDDV